MEWRMRNNNQNTRPTNESERMLMWTYPYVTVILVNGWTEKGRATMSLLSYSFSRCAHTNNVFFFFWYLVCLFRFSHWTLEWKKKSQVLLWFEFSIELPGTTDEQYVISLTMMTGKKNAQTNIQNINQQPKTSSHQHYCGTLLECACIGLLALMASLSKFIQCESERKCTICANKWPVVDRPMWNK